MPYDQGIKGAAASESEFNILDDQTCKIESKIEKGRCIQFVAEEKDQEQSYRKHPVSGSHAADDNPRGVLEQRKRHGVADPNGFVQP